MKRPVIEIQDLRFSYPASGFPVLDGITLNVHEGEWISVMGPTGAGKSTLSLCMNGIIPHIQGGEMRGMVALFGEDTKESSVPVLSSKVGLVFQDFDTQLFSSQVDLEMAFGLENLCVESQEMKRRVEGALREFGLSHYVNRQPSQLSGGERQRLVIAAVFVLSPRILVLDEPTTDLDPASKERLLSLVKGLHKEGVTIIWIDHESELALESDRVLVMEKGRVAHDTTCRAFFGSPGTPEHYGIRGLDIPALFKGKAPTSVPLNYDEAIREARKPDGEIKWAFKKGDASGLAHRCAPDNPGAPLIIIKDLEYTYPNGTKALNGITIDIRQGEFVAIVGQNGSGKTTLARHLNGLLKPARGRVIVKGVDTKAASIHQLSRHVGYCFQNPDTQIFASTVMGEVSFGPKNYQIPQSLADQWVREALEAVSLTGYEEKDPFVLTKGERQRIAVASVLSLKPEIMIFDEPTTGLDYCQMTGMMELIKRLNREGRTIIMITHSMWVAARYARRCIVMSRGCVLLDADTRHVFSQEDVLRQASLAPPDIVRLGNALGATTLTAEEFMERLV